VIEHFRDFLFDVAGRDFHYPVVRLDGVAQPGEVVGNRVSIHLFLIGPQLGAAKIRKFRSSSLQLYSEISVKTTGLGFRGAAHGFFRQPAK
jgi:hypothetical protein